MRVRKVSVDPLTAVTVPETKMGLAGAATALASGVPVPAMPKILSCPRVFPDESRYAEAT